MIIVFITNYPMRIYTTDVIPTSIVSDHDAPFACTNVRVNRYQPRYKYIRNMKTFDEQEFISDLDTLPLNIVSSSDDLEEQLEYFNSMFKECLERHAPLRRVRVTRPPAPYPGWTTAKYRHYNSCGINSGRRPTTLALRSPRTFFLTSETS